MKSNIFKKIIILTYLVIFLFGLFIPFNQSFAQTKPLFISTGDGDFSSGKTITITAYNDSKFSLQTVSFKSTPESGTFTPSSCETNGKSSQEAYFYCSVTFTSKGGTFKISATTGTVVSNEITITNGTYVPACTPPQTSVAGVCTDPPPPPPVNTETTYTPLAGLPGLPADKAFQTDPGCQRDTNGNIIPGSCTNPCPFGNYLNIIIKLVIGIAAVLAMVMIVMGGIEYMTSELVSGKEAGKETITHAILGLLIALGAFLILNTINPQLLNACLDKLPIATIEIGGDTDMPTVFNKNSLPSGIVCSGNKSNIPNIVKSFSGKMTYEMGAKGNAGPNNTIKLDCSGFVNYVLDCANSNFVSGGTASIFSNAEKVTSISGNKVNNKDLQIGDLVGWRAGDLTTDKYGHVMIYVGNGNVEVADSNGGGGKHPVGGALGIFNISKYQNSIKFIRRIP